MFVKFIVKNVGQEPERERMEKEKETHRGEDRTRGAVGPRSRTRRERPLGLCM